jgi:hypothetical protein
VAPRFVGKNRLGESGGRRTEYVLISSIRSSFEANYYLVGSQLFRDIPHPPMLSVKLLG